MGYRFFTNKSCPYFPCHEGVDPEEFNCLFCYCPLYLLYDQCGGDFVILPNGVKSCEHCAFPHKKENYEEMIERISHRIFKKEK